jgi:hypothetical protein
MKAVTRFQALDGTEFDTEEKCRHYEDICREVSDIMSELPHTEIHGEGFVKLSGPVVLSVQRKLVMLWERLHPSMVNQHTEWARNATVPAGMTLIGRYIDDCGPRPIASAWRRLMRIDSQFREYEQPYYAIRADKALDEAK